MIETKEFAWPISMQNSQLAEKNHYLIATFIVLRNFNKKNSHGQLACKIHNLR